MAPSLDRVEKLHKVRSLHFRSPNKDHQQVQTLRQHHHWKHLQNSLDFSWHGPAHYQVSAQQHKDRMASSSREQQRQNARKRWKVRHVQHNADPLGADTVAPADARRTVRPMSATTIRPLDRRSATLFATGATQVAAAALDDPTKITVTVQEVEYVPSWLVDSNGETRSHLAPLVRHLRDRGITGFSAWHELTCQHPALGGAILKEVASSDMGTALSAIRRHYR